MLQSATYFSSYLQKRIMGNSMQIVMPAELESIPVS